MNSLALIAAIVLAPAADPVPPEKQAELLLSEGRANFNNEERAASAKAFETILAKFGNTPAAIHAQYSLGTVKLTAEPPDLAKAIELLTPPANNGGFTDRGMALYHLAVGYRLQGLAELDQATDANALQERKKSAEPKFSESLRRFREARDWFTWKQQFDWAGRARCDETEMLLRLDKVREARSTAEPFAKDPSFAKNAHRAMGLYYYGQACFLDGNYNEAGLALNQVAPFDQPGFGEHARYLAGRVLHLAGEENAASVQYETILDQHRKRTDPKRPAPAYVSGAAYYLACLRCDAGKVDEVLNTFLAFPADHPASPFLPDASLRAGYCLVQLGRFDEATKLLEPVPGATPRLADQAQYWLAQARYGLARSTPENERPGKLSAAAGQMRQAADRAGQMLSTDPDAKHRRHEMLLGCAEAYVAAGRAKDAGGLLEQLWNEQALPTRRDDLLLRQITAWTAAGDHGRSDQRCEEFFRNFPDSVLAPVVRYRLAENAVIRADEIAKRNDRNQIEELHKRLHESTDKFAALSAKQPEHRLTAVSRLAAAVCLKRIGNPEPIIETLAKVPVEHRNGELAPISLLHADSLILTTASPPVTETQLQKYREELAAAEAMLSRFLSTDPAQPLSPLAKLRLGQCRIRMAELNTDNRNPSAIAAREILETLLRDFPDDPLSGYARIELAKTRTLQGDRDLAVQELQNFMNGEHQSSPYAPLAVVRLANLYRRSEQFTEAEQLLASARSKFEGGLGKDPERSDWIQLLRCHHAIALADLGQWDKARALFDQVYNEAKGQPISVEAALRSVQCRIVEARKKLAVGKAAYAAATDGRQRTSASKVLAEARGESFKAADELLTRGSKLRSEFPMSEVRARMYYDAAWVHREQAELDLPEAWDLVKKQVARRQAEELLGKLPPRTQLPQWPLPDVPRSEVPVQPFERRAQAAYDSLITEFPVLAIAIDARLELAEMLRERAEHAAIVPLLRGALDAKPHDRPADPETMVRIRLRLGDSLMATGNPQEAYEHYVDAATEAPSSYQALAIDCAGEALLAAGKPVEAAEQLDPFAKPDGLLRSGSIAERGVLRLGQAELAAMRWERARSAFDQFLAEFGAEHPLAPEAYYGVGLAYQNQNQFAEAMAAYRLAARSTSRSVAAMSQVQIANCLIGEGKPLEAAAEALLSLTHEGGAESRRAALLTAAAAFTQADRTAEAERLLTQLLAELPTNHVWAKAARERLELLADAGR